MAAGGWGGVGAWGAGNKSGGAWAQEDVEGAPASVTQQQPQQPQQGGSYIGGYAPPAAQQPSQPSGFNAGAFSSRFGGGSAPSGPQDLASREAAVKKKEAELARKEAELAKLEADIKAAGGSIRRKNWPRCYPLLHHDINEEIPEKSRRPVREAYMAWWGLLVCLSWQVFCASVMLGYKQADQRVASWFLSLIYWMCGVPLSFILWYRKVYFGAMSDSTYKWLSFFLWFAVHFGFCVWSAIAVPFSAEQWSFSGFVTAAKALDIASFPGVIYFIGASLWSCEAAFSLWVIRDVWWFFRNKGGVEKAQQEAAMAAVRQGVKSQSQPTTGRV